MPDPERLRTLIEEFYERMQIPEVPPWWDYEWEEGTPDYDNYPWNKPLT